MSVSHDFLYIGHIRQDACNVRHVHHEDFEVTKIVLGEAQEASSNFIRNLCVYGYMESGEVACVDHMQFCMAYGHTYGKAYDSQGFHHEERLDAIYATRKIVAGTIIVERFVYDFEKFETWE
eukprot:2786075-Pleurochrysis_carterae.AAC.2